VEGSTAIVVDSRLVIWPGATRLLLDFPLCSDASPLRNNNPRDSRAEELCAAGSKV